MTLEVVHVVAPTTVRTRYNYVAICLRGAVGDRIIAHSPAASVRLPKVRRAAVAMDMAIPSPQQLETALREGACPHANWLLGRWFWHRAKVESGVELTREYPVTFLAFTRPYPGGVPEQRRGLLLGVVAYGLWGGFPLYWPLLEPAGAIEILAHRILWSMVTIGLLVVVFRRTAQLRAILADRRTLLLLAAAALIITVNWATYIYGVNNERSWRPRSATSSTRW